MAKSKYRAKKVFEAGGQGAGYAVSGGNWGRSFGNPSGRGHKMGRGVGFGSANTSGGPNVMYTYNIVPLNHYLEQEPTPHNKYSTYIHTGSLVQGKTFGDKEQIVGKIINIERDSHKNILSYEVMDSDEGEIKELDPTTVNLIHHSQYAQPNDNDYISEPGDMKGISESFYPRLNECV